ncbi:hypothetical protein GCM10023346_21100 [Arthrobacter gyeryongensis]|uniref:HTH luxR-type domain-containing protein n=1 Tax=Arthrobacter gyeryongensis TaxID=1650592 RepID=A0ABP9SES8_9MICC
MDPVADLAAQLHGLGDRDSYLRAAGELMCRLFPSEMIGWHQLDGAARTAEIVPYPDIPLEGFAQRLVDTADENPFFRSYVTDLTVGMWQPRRLSDLVTDLELHRTRTYSEGLRPLSIDRQIALLSERKGAVSVRAWVISRLHRDFTDDEVELTCRLQPLLRLLETAYGDSRQLPEDASCSEAYSLTAREHEILQLLGRGLTGVAIGHLLGISPRTVAKHLEHAYAKLGCTNRIDALRHLRGE